MPTYRYEILENGEPTGEYFELEQRASDTPLTRHPITRQAVRKVYTTPNIGKKHTAGKTQKLLDKANLEKHGFLRYERDKVDNSYYKTAGKSGPERIKRQ